MAFHSHGSVAAKVRKSKEAHPERYCRHATCLWRVLDRHDNPTPCPRHSASAANERLGPLRQNVEATAGVPS